MDLQSFGKELKSVITDFKGVYETKLDRIQQQVDAMDLNLRKVHVGGGGKSFSTILQENESVARLMRDRKGSAVLTLSGDEVAQLMEQKTTLTLTSAGGFGTPGVVSVERMPGIVTEARRKLRMRDVLDATPTDAGLIYYVKVNNPLANASPVSEGSQKSENAVTFTPASERVKTIATWIPMSRQVLEDFKELDGFLRAGLPYYVNKEEDHQILLGDNTGENLNGLYTQSTAFDSSLLSGSWTLIDQIGAAIQQIQESDEIDPTFVVLNPRDAWHIRRTKDTQGRYLLGDPQSAGRPSVWDLTQVSTTAMGVGSFLIGSGDPAAAQIRDRMEMQVEISTEHSDYFTKNLVAIRAEKRVALVVSRPASFIHGTLATSP